MTRPPVHYVPEGEFVKSSRTDATYCIKETFDCWGVVYVLSCRSCQTQYAGRTYDMEMKNLRKQQVRGSNTDVCKHHMNVQVGV